MDLPPAPTCHRLPQLATRGISFNFHVFFGVPFLLLLRSLFALPLLLLLRLLLDVLLRQFHSLFAPRHTLFSEGDYKYLCLDWRQQARWHSQHTLSFFPSSTLPLRLPFSFPLLFGAIWSICLATSVEMNNKYRKYFGKRNSIRRTDADLITGHVLV